MHTPRRLQVRVKTPLSPRPPYFLSFLLHVSVLPLVFWAHLGGWLIRGEFLTGNPNVSLCAGEGLCNGRGTITHSSKPM